MKLAELSDEELKRLRAELKHLTFGERCGMPPSTPPSEHLRLFYAVNAELTNRRKDKFL